MKKLRPGWGKNEFMFQGGKIKERMRKSDRQGWIFGCRALPRGHSLSLSCDSSLRMSPFPLPSLVPQQVPTHLLNQPLHQPGVREVIGGGHGQSQEEEATTCWWRTEGR